MIQFPSPKLLMLIAGTFAFAQTMTTSKSALADETSPGSSIRIIVPAAHAEEAAMRSIVEALESHLADLNVRVEQIDTQSLPETPEVREQTAREQLLDKAVLAVLWCLPENGRYRVFIYLENSPSSDMPSVRGIEVAGAEGTGETLGVILHASVSALLERPVRELPAAAVLPQPSQQIPTPAPEPASPLPTVPKNPPPQVKRELMVIDAAYAVDFPVMAWAAIHGAYFAVALRIFDYVRIHLSYAVTSLYRVEDATVNLAIRRHPVGFGIQLFFRQRLVEPRFRFSAVVDYASTDLSLKDDTMKSDAPDGQMQIYLEPRVELGINFYKNLQIYVGLGLDLFVLRPKYTVNTEDGVRTIFDPLAVQPLATAGLTATFF